MCSRMSGESRTTCTPPRACTLALAAPHLMFRATHPRGSCLATRVEHDNTHKPSAALQASRRLSAVSTDEDRQLADGTVGCLPSEDEQE